MAHLKNRLPVNPVRDTHFEANYSLGKMLYTLIDETHLCDFVSSEYVTIVYTIVQGGPLQVTLAGFKLHSYRG